MLNIEVSLIFLFWKAVISRLHFVNSAVSESTIHFGRNKTRMLHLAERQLAIVTSINTHTVAKLNSKQYPYLREGKYIIL